MAGEREGAALVIGVVSVDVIEHAEGEMISAGFGGVSHNVARALAGFGVKTQFLSPSYGGDLAAGLTIHLAGAGVEWRPLGEEAPFAHFFAEIGAKGKLGRHRFCDNGAFGPLSAAPLRRVELPDPCPALVTCTDLDLDALQTLRELASTKGVPFWLIVSDPTTASRARTLDPRADVCCLNSGELEHLFPVRLDRRAMAEAAGELVGAAGVVAVTLGERGALLVDKGPREYWLQAEDEPIDLPALGAGDVFSGALLAARLRTGEWRESLRLATGAARAFVAEGVPALREERLRVNPSSLEPRRGEL